MVIRKQWLAVLILIGVLTACGGQSPMLVATSAPVAKAEVEGGAYTNVTPQQLVEMLKKKGFFFVNVHIPYRKSRSMSKSDITTLAQRCA